MPGTIEYLWADNIVTSVGNGIGPGISASQWHKYAVAILRWQQLTCTVSGAGTWPSAHTVKALKKQLNTCCSNVQPTIRPGGTRGQETASKQTCDVSGATWNRLGWWPSPWPGMRSQNQNQNHEVKAETRRTRPSLRLKQIVEAEITWSLGQKVESKRQWHHRILCFNVLTKPTHNDQGQTLQGQMLKAIFKAKTIAKAKAILLAQRGSISSG